MELEGTVIGGIVIPDGGGASLDEGARVTIIAPSAKRGDIPVAEESQGIRSLAELLKDFKGVVDDLPSDYAEQLDHYLYGTPKR